MIDILLPDTNGSVTITGTRPLVIIGPNGVGKTQLGGAITRANSAQLRDWLLPLLMNGQVTVI